MNRDQSIGDLIREKDRTIKKQAEIIERQSKVIYEADKMYDAGGKLPTEGNENNREFARTRAGYQAAKEKASGEQEAR